MNLRKPCPLAWMLLFFAIGARAAAPDALPDTNSLEHWRSPDGLADWRADRQKGTLRFDRQRAGSLVAAGPCWETRGEVTFHLQKVHGRWARLELRFRGSGDGRDYCAAVVEPRPGRVLFEKVADAKPAPAAKAATLSKVDWTAPHKLGYRIEGRRATLFFDGQEVVSADGVVPTHAGHLGLAAAFVHVDLSRLNVETALPHIADRFDALTDWTVYYGPEAWTVAASAPGKAPGERPENRAAVFSAKADGALIGAQEGTHFTAEVRGKFVDAPSRWTCFGLRPKVTADRGSFYVIEVRAKQSKLVLWKQLKGKRDPAVDRTVDLPPVELGRWYTLRCTLRGHRVQVELDGRKLIDLVDASPIRSGRTAISASHGTVHVDDFRQQELESDYRFAEAEPAWEPYDPGPALPAPAAGAKDLREDAHYWYLQGDGLRAAIHRRTGMLGGLAVPGGKGWPVRRALGLYKLETRESQTRADAYGDQVEHVERPSDRELLVRCTNPALPGVALEKLYRLDSSGQRLIQEVALVNRTDRTDVFLTLAQRAVLDPAFRSKAIYTGGGYFGPLVPAQSIRQRVLADAFKVPWKRGITNGRPSWILALNHELGRHVATYRYRVNGHYVLPWNSIWTEELNNLYHTPQGWEMGVATLHLKPNERRSAEVHHLPFRGSRLDFYNAYMDLPEVKRMYARVGPRPAWLADVKMPIYVPNAYRLSFTEDGVLLNLQSPFGVWGDLPTRGTVRTAGGIARWPVERVRQKVRDAKALSPRIKAGLYTWAWSAHRHSEIAGEHPEWFIRTDKSGEPRNAYPLAMSYLRCLSAPGCLESTLRTFHELVRFYEEDFQYLDNDGTGAQVIDWEHLRIDQDYHWQRLHEGIVAAARGRSPDTATFFNNRVLPQGDIAFAEFMTAEIQNTDWRRPANEMVPLKVFQKRDPDRVIPLLYWRAENEPGYVNYCVGLGLMPFDDTLKRLPFVNAAFETRRLEIMDAGLSPDWQRDLQTDTEAYALRQGQAAVVSLVGHQPTPTEVEVAFDSARMGLKPGQPYTAWLFELKHPRDHAGRLTERLQRTAYVGARWADELVVAGRRLQTGASLADRYRARVTVRPQRLRMLVVTHSPALVWSIGGRRTNFWLPTVRHIDCSGRWNPAADRAEIQCRSEHRQAALVVPVPPGRRVAELKVDGKPAAWHPERVPGAWLARFSVTEGRHRVELQFAPQAAPPASRPRELKAPGSVVAGETLRVQATCSGDPGGAPCEVAVRVLQDGIVVAATPPQRLDGSAATFDVPIPRTARPGTYDVALGQVGFCGEDPRARFEILPGAWKPAPPPHVDKGQPTVKIWSVNRTVKGLRVLRAGTDTFDHRGGVQIAELDADKLAARCGLEADSESPWGYGFCGIEVQGAKTITVDLRNNFAQPHQEGTKLAIPCPDTFAGIIIDYHTPAGYTHRVALGLGVQQEDHPVHQPHWGKAARPDRNLVFGKTILEKPRDRIRVDLKQYAPADWDGRAWFSVGVDTVFRGLELNAEFRGE